MTVPFTIECDIHVRRLAHGAKERRCGELAPAAVVPAGRIPRVARLMALAIHFDDMIRTRRVKKYAELACLGHVSHARISQIASLVLLAPDIQEELLFLPAVQRGRAPVLLRHLLPIAASADWASQRRKWRELRRLVSRRS